MGVYARRDSRFRILPIIGTRAPPGADVAAALFVRISPRLLREIRRTLFSRSRSSLTACDRNSAVYPPFGMRPICSLRLANSTKRWTLLFPACATFLNRANSISMSFSGVWPLPISFSLPSRAAYNQFFRLPTANDNRRAASLIGKPSTSTSLIACSRNSCV